MGVVARAQASAPTEVASRMIGAAAAGEVRAQTALVRFYEARVIAHLSRLLAGHHEVAKDLAQETFLRVLKALSGFDSAGPARLSSWILTIATRLAIDFLRRPRAKWVPLPEVAARSTQESQVAARELGEKMVRAMTKMTPEQRAILTLRIVEDLEYGEIAAALGLELGTVKSRLARSRDALRAALKEEGADDV